MQKVAKDKDDHLTKGDIEKVEMFSVSMLIMGYGCPSALSWKNAAVRMIS